MYSLVRSEFPNENGRFVTFFAIKKPQSEVFFKFYTVGFFNPQVYSICSLQLIVAVLNYLFAVNISVSSFLKVMNLSLKPT